MNARDKLRLYLEQRRELGETEFVLDSMSVDDVLKTVGAIAKGKPLAPPTPREMAQSSSGDWRTVLAAQDSDQARATEPLRAAEPSASLSVEGANDELFDSDIMRHASLESIAKAVKACTRCPLYKTATNGVPGEGDPKARLVCVGEAPGANEDETGRPFVGQAGQLLTKILAAVDLTREEVFITNVVKHRPPGNRNPTPGEIRSEEHTSELQSQF